MKFKVFCVSVTLICSLLPGISLAQNKVVVIPLMREAPLEPYAPLAAESPSASAYFDNPMGGHVTDKATGLVWQKSDDDDLKTWSEAREYCQNLELPSGGWTDWRLPSVEELISIVDYGAHDPAINSVFWGTEQLPYWSATTMADDSGGAQIVGFINGTVSWDYRSAEYYVRCVRRLSARDNIFKNNNNGTVSDLSTGLMWQRENDNIIIPWDDANSYCQELSLGGKHDWRLPNVKELQSIADGRIKNPVIDTEVFIHNGIFFWSATTRADNSQYAWFVRFDNGDCYFLGKLSYNLVRCVR